MMPATAELYTSCVHETVWSIAHLCTSSKFLQVCSVLKSGQKSPSSYPYSGYSRKVKMPMSDVHMRLMRMASRQ